MFLKRFAEENFDFAGQAVVFIAVLDVKVFRHSKRVTVGIDRNDWYVESCCRNIFKVESVKIFSIRWGFVIFVLVEPLNFVTLFFFWQSFCYKQKMCKNCKEF